MGYFRDGNDEGNGLGYFEDGKDEGYLAYGYFMLSGLA